MEARRDFTLSRAGRFDAVGSYSPLSLGQSRMVSNREVSDLSSPVVYLPLVQ